MKIDRNTGTVSFVCGNISFAISVQEFLASSCVNGAKLVLENEGWVRYDFRPELKVYAQSLFYKNLLTELNLVLSGDENLSWENWTAERELLQKTIHDNWLLEEFGKPPYKFSWGSIISVYDEKSAASLIILKYTWNGTGS